MYEPERVRAPQGAIAWSETYGWIGDLETHTEARMEGQLLLDVEDGYVDDVEGEATLAQLMRVDAHLFQLRREHDRFVEVVSQVVEDVAVFPFLKP